MTQSMPADPFSDPASGGTSPHPRNLIGRTVVLVPKSIDENSSFEGASRPKITADVIVIDGGPVTYGESLDPTSPRPATERRETPAMWTSAWINSESIVNALRPQVGRGIVVGRIERGTQGRRPPILRAIDQNDPGRAAAREIWFQVQSGTFVNPEPTPLAGGAPIGGFGLRQQTSTPVPAQQYGVITPQAVRQAQTGPQRPAHVPQEAWDKLTPDVQRMVSDATVKPAF